MSLDVDLTCSHCGTSVFDANITHNLGAMAQAAGIYMAVWRPDEAGHQTAGEIVEPLKRGLRWLRAHPAEARKHEPENHWGTYDDFVPWLERYLAACEKHPTAKISVCR